MYLMKWTKKGKENIYKIYAKIIQWKQNEIL